MDDAFNTFDGERPPNFFTAAFRREIRLAYELVTELGGFVQVRLGALGLALDALVLFTTRCANAVAKQLRADGCDARDEDVARLLSCSYGITSICWAGTPSGLPSGLCPLRDPGRAEGE
ncbi:hypothetical protein ACIRPX_45825 [Streptomyces sp. NPDC101225]|uniref:hypothetical protein n=1 Tax=Streptomyces sp. NPDC101225 TaxID=3366135 RepID=UPI0037F203F9